MTQLKHQKPATISKNLSNADNAHLKRIKEFGNFCKQGPISWSFTTKFWKSAKNFFLFFFFSKNGSFFFFFFFLFLLNLPRELLAFWLLFFSFFLLSWSCFFVVGFEFLLPQPPFLLLPLLTPPPPHWEWRCWVGRRGENQGLLRTGPRREGDGPWTARRPLKVQDQREERDWGRTQGTAQPGAPRQSPGGRGGPKRNERVEGRVLVTRWLTFWQERSF